MLNLTNIWLAPRAGRMNQIARCDWLSERARWSHLARSGLPAVSRMENFPESHIINPFFWSMFPFFHLAWSTWSATGTFVADRENAALWLVDLPEREQICCAPSCESDEKRATKPTFVAQSRPTLYFSQHFFQPATNVFVARQVNYARWKQETSTKTCNETMLHDKLRVSVSRISPPLRGERTCACVISVVFNLVPRVLSLPRGWVVLRILQRLDYGG